jgi:hypothetical protein
MLQTIITIIIVVIAFIITVIRVVRFFTSPAGKCKGCSQYKAVCSLQEKQLRRVSL